MNEEPDMDLQHNLRLGLQQVIVAERAIELSYDDGIDANLDDLLEAAHSVLNSIEEPE